jgi:hypothetical protein
VKKYFYFLLFVILSAGCTRYYAPPAQNIPLLSHEDEIQINPGLSFFGPYASAAFSPLKHVGITGNVLTDWASKRSLQYGEVAAGIYKGYEMPFNLELYAGYGHGVSSVNDSVYDFWFKRSYINGRGRYDNFFLQANVGLRIDSNLYVAGAMRYFSFNYQADFLRLNDEVLMNTSFPGQGFELSYQMSFGMKWLYAVTGGTLSLMAPVDEKKDKFFKYNAMMFWGGLIFKIDYAALKKKH